MIWDWHDFTSGSVYLVTISFQVLFILVELVLGYRSRFISFNWHELRASMLIQLTHIFCSFILGQAVIIRLLFLVYEHRIFDPQFPAWVMFAYAFFLVDFAQYATHVFDHYFRWGWAMHIVHHTPERINFSAGFRLGIPHALSTWWLSFILLVWLAGVPPLLIVTSYTLNALYQFFCHSELVPKLGWIEYVFSTPATHRVHHGYNPEYRNHNFGGVFTIFDRLFGTYKAEDPAVPIRYGLGREVPRAFWALAFMGWRELAADVFGGKKNRSGAR